MGRHVVTETRWKMGVNRAGRQGLWKEGPVSSPQGGGGSPPIILHLRGSGPTEGPEGFASRCPPP